MRLAKLRLSGFKSFVDPTLVALPGQMVGVVGPNGCGKSNIIDAVRWVLGESKASELRGESMQDVIFNGSGDRKPVARASVELVFDNTLGRVPGQWGQYAELAVKRVLSRSGQSDYFINNLKVRRKDITNLFLGTGLGPRAYAIIGQGMISRIVEARPDDLRVFLEEAAGVTRYKERRRETEGRLEDTRENLARVEDIRLELGQQVEKLQVQAEAARQYHEFNNLLTQKQQVLWVLRRNEAKEEERRKNLEVQQAMTYLEAAVAALREKEARLEEAREAHFSAGDSLHQAQSGLFAANAKIAHLEAEIRHLGESVRQAESRFAQLENERLHWDAQTEKLETDRQRWEELRQLACRRLEEANAKTQADQVFLASKRQTDAKAEADRLRHEAAQLEKRLQAELIHQNYARKNLEALVCRRETLKEEEGILSNAPDYSLARQEKEETLSLILARQDEAQLSLAALRERLLGEESRYRGYQEARERHKRDMAVLEARRGVLEELQPRADQDQVFSAWLRTRGLENAIPLWRQLHVEPGWELAVEALLRERLNTIPCPENLDISDESRPGARLSLRIFAKPENGLYDKKAPLPGSLLERLRVDDEAWMPLLSDWFGQVCTAESLSEALQKRQLPNWTRALVTRQGDYLEQNCLSFFAPDAIGQGVLERQREIEAVNAGLLGLFDTLETVETNLAGSDKAVKALREEEQAWVFAQNEAQTQIHALQVEILKYAESFNRHLEQSAQLARRQEQLALEEAEEGERAFSAEAAAAQLREAQETLREEESGARLWLESAELALREAQEQSAANEREIREAQFSLRECESKFQEILSGQELAKRQLSQIAIDLSDCQARQAEQTKVEDCNACLQEALSCRAVREKELAQERENMESATHALRLLEEERLKIEQSLSPLRDGLNELKLKEQAAALNAGQIVKQLEEAGADEETLKEALENAKPQVLSQEIGRLQKSLLSLGAVNLAALEELAAASERKSYLDLQSADLAEAMNTLENAIRRIDRETRELLQNTFDTVNEHFGKLFPELFGGGKAALVMTGEEVLDAGIQVFAQPPGKKNSTIHLLSGGEKALTAIALIFSIFQLNPAPFCLLDEVDAPLDDTNTERFCNMVRKMSWQTQFLFISHNKIAMEMAEQLIGVTMRESGVSRVVEVDVEAALKMKDAA